MSRVAHFRACAWTALAVAVAACGGDASELLGVSKEAQVICARGATVRGVDVSTFQGNVDWAGVKASGIDFAITRISDGPNSPDAHFGVNWAGMKSVGLVRGAYQYFEPDLDALAQADLVVQKVGRLGAMDLPAQLDIEVAGALSSAELVNAMKLWMDRVTTGTGKRPMIYTAPNFWNSSVGGADFASDGLWIANWGVTCPNLPDPWSSWTLWQTSSTGVVPGIAGNVDTDVFNGSMDDLERFAGTVPDASTVTDAGRGAIHVDAGSHRGDASLDAGDLTGSGAGGSPTGPVASSGANDDGGCGCRIADARIHSGPSGLVGGFAWCAVLPCRRRNRRRRSASFLARWL